MFNPKGTEYIAELINKAVEDGSRTAKISGEHIIDSAVRIPSDFTLILEDCHLRLADGCYSNIFVNEHYDAESGRERDGVDRNIALIGRGRAILDGGEYNNLSERNHSRDGMPPIWKNNLVLFANVDQFKISGITCINQRWWALNFIYCRNGYLGNIDFCANDAAIDSKGNLYHGLIRSRGAEALVKNADGIDLRQGCHDIIIENITGFTEDDTIAITGLNGILEKTFGVTDLDPDICNITVKNIRAASFCTIVRLLNQGDMKIHDIEIDGVYDTSDRCPHLDMGLYAVRVGDTRLYGTRQATCDETYNISIKNVSGRSDYAIALAGEIGNLVMNSIECRDGCRMLLDNRDAKI